MGIDNRDLPGCDNNTIENLTAAVESPGLQIVISSNELRVEFPLGS